jgi:tetratricopeptide (TPR) repeat protein
MVFWFIVFILPQSGLFAINAFVSEHFIYLSSISIFLGLVFLLNRFLKMRILIPVCAALILFYGTLTVSRIYDWKDPLLFYQKIIKFSPDSFQAHNNLGLQYEFRNKLDLAAQEYLKAIAIKPDLLEAHSNLANLYFKMGLLKEAKQEYAIVEKIAPAGKAGEIQNNIGCVYEVEGRLDEALEKYNLALKLDPSLSFAHFNIARVSLARKDFDRAASEVLKSLPETLPAKESIRIVREQLASGNSFADGTVFYNDLGVRFAQSKDFVNATRAFKRSLELRPMYADAHFNLGLAYWNMGKKREAELAFKDAIRSGPGHARAEAFLRERVCKK